jgi:hypothetical protein
MVREIFPMPITMDRRDTSLTVAEPLGMLQAGTKRTRHFSYSLRAGQQNATRFESEMVAALR